MGSSPLMGSALMGGTPLLELLLYGSCSFLGGAPLWVDPLYGKCHYMGGASLREVPLSENTPYGWNPFMGSAP